MAFDGPRPDWPYWFTRVAFYSYCRGYLGLTMRGTDNVPARGPAILMANHESYFDPYLLTFLSIRPVAFMAKIELFEGKLGWFFPRLNCLPVKRGTADLTAFRESARLLQRGHLLGIFPEGTRTADGTMGPAHRGSISIAIRTGVPIVPVAIWGTYQVLPRSGGLRRHPVGVSVGRPYRLVGLPRDAHRNKPLLDRIGRRIMADIATLRSQLIEEQTHVAE
ncbi:MAG: 1-acyl-sn-glycerol-3-phosphate acyltransferase [Armatimonadetes bacterium]|nr:1-acyl-sn-glycerol-3-phosphate acyltransferase [Armatimonadota bacterium]